MTQSTISTLYGSQGWINVALSIWPFSSTIPGYGPGGGDQFSCGEL